jgi:predicted component of type VI protein secretion system
MDCKLIVMLGGVEGETYALREGTITVGRDTDNDIQFISDRVSRRHAKFTNLSAACRIEDLDTTNGTFVNGRKITSYDLKQGDQITIGDMVLRFDEASAWEGDGQIGSAQREYSERSHMATVMVEKRPEEDTPIARKESVSPFRLKSAVVPTEAKPTAQAVSPARQEMAKEKAKTQPISGLGGLLRLKTAAKDGTKNQP